MTCDCIFSGKAAPCVSCTRRGGGGEDAGPAGLLQSAEQLDINAVRGALDKLEVRSRSAGEGRCSCTVSTRMCVALQRTLAVVATLVGARPAQAGGDCGADEEDRHEGGRRGRCGAWEGMIGSPERAQRLLRRLARSNSHFCACGSGCLPRQVTLPSLPASDGPRFGKLAARSSRARVRDTCHPGASCVETSRYTPFIHLPGRRRSRLEAECRGVRARRDGAPAEASAHAGAAGGPSLAHW